MTPTDDKNIKPVFLIGYMGSGKTTIGKLLAKALKRDFTDTDDVLETQCGMSCSQLMQTDGENKFRMLEQQVLHRVAKQPKAIIGTGGGMPCYADNMFFMNKNGLTVFLNWSVENLAIRLELTDIHKRPMLCGKSGAELRRHIQAQLEKRLPFYAQAQYQINCNDMTDNEITKLIQLKLTNEC